MVLSRIKRELCAGLAPRENMLCRKLAGGYNIGGGFKRIYHYHVRKCGGTSLNQMFLSVEGTDGQKDYAELSKSLNYRIIRNDKVFVGWNKKLIEEGNYFYGFSHTPMHELKLPPKTFTITCLRDPCERVLSLYRMLKEYQEKKIRHPSMPVQLKWLGKSFNDFLLLLPRERLLRQIYMFSPTYDVEEAFTNIRRCSFYYFLEDLDGAMKKLSNRLNIPLKPKHVRKSSFQAELDQGQLDLLLEVLKPELQLVSKLKLQGAKEHSF